MNRFIQVIDEGGTVITISVDAIALFYSMPGAGSRTKIVIESGLFINATGPPCLVAEKIEAAMAGEQPAQPGGGPEPILEQKGQNFDTTA